MSVDAIISKNWSLATIRKFLSTGDCPAHSYTCSWTAAVVEW